MKIHLNKWFHKFGDVLLKPYWNLVSPQTLRAQRGGAATKFLWASMTFLPMLKFHCNLIELLEFQSSRLILLNKI